jgi:hypothetical protein
MIVAAVTAAIEAGDTPSANDAAIAAAPEAVDDPVTFSYWDTAKLGQMIQIKRLHLREAQAKFEASGELERRLKKRFFDTERAAQYVRRIEDQVSMMRAELERRAINSAQA